MDETRYILCSFCNSLMEIHINAARYKCLSCGQNYDEVKSLFEMTKTSNPSLEEFNNMIEIWKSVLLSSVDDDQIQFAKLMLKRLVTWRNDQYPMLDESKPMIDRMIIDHHQKMSTIITNDLLKQMQDNINKEMWLIELNCLMKRVEKGK